MPHIYKLGQRVRQSSTGTPMDRTAPTDIYEIIRLMPEDRGGDPCYRIKSPVGERAVSQADIVPA